MNTPAATLSKELLEKITAKLHEEKTSLEAELNKLGKPATTDEEGTAFPNYGDKEDENAAEVAEFATNLSLEQTLEKTLRDVNSTLDRLKKGTYGICKYCKNPIDEKRLLARPTSSSCVECKKTITQEA